MELLFGIIILWSTTAFLATKDDKPIDSIKVGETQTRIIMQKREVIQTNEILKEWSDK